MKIMRFSLFLCGCLALLGSCKKEAASSTETLAPRPAAVDTTALLVTEVARTARLYTAECVVRKVVTYSDEPRVQGKLFGMDVDLPSRIGQRKVAIPIEVTLKAYVDFSNFSARQIARTDSTLTLTLPDPVIISTATKVDHAGTQQYVDLTRSRFTDAEMAGFAAQGADSVMSHLALFGIEEQARRSAAQTLLPMLRRMGYRDDQVTVKFRKEFNNKELRTFVVGEKR